VVPEDHRLDDEEVRRLLAALSSSADPTPLPDRVAAHLDDVLAGLVAERSAPPETAARDLPSVVDLTERRRRRRLPAVLVAAASVAVVALGITNVLSNGSGAGNDSSASSNSASSARKDGPAAGDTLVAPDTSVPTPSPGARMQAGKKKNPLGAGSGAASGTQKTLPRLHRASLDADVRRIAGSAAASTPKNASPQLSDRSRCELPPAARRDQVVAVRLDGRHATLVLRAAKGGTREAEVYACHDVATPVARTSTGVR
jgi:hypothetical protein